MKDNVNSSITRKGFLKNIAATAALVPFVNTTLLKGNSISSTPKKKRGSKRILHITDVHIRPNPNTDKAKSIIEFKNLKDDWQAEQRCKKIIEEIFNNENNKIDLILNGGDSIWAADYDKISKEEALLQWEAWDRSVMATIRKYYKGPILSSLGNHDMWWAGKGGSKEDKVYGKDYVVKRLKSKGRYFAEELFAWKFIVLDCNNSNILDEEQLSWYKNEVEITPKNQNVIILTHQPIVFSKSLINKGMTKRQKDIILPWQDNKNIKPQKVYFLSGHEHILDIFHFSNIGIYCNGAMSGYWWNYGAAQKNCSYEGTPMGYALIDIEESGNLICNYYDVTDAKDGQLI